MYGLRDVKPNAILKRSVWSTPQKGQSCHLCKFWAPRYTVEYDPADQRTYEKLIDGRCQNLRIWAAYGEPVSMRSYYSCNFYKEKEDGSKYGD